MFSLNDSNRFFLYPHPTDMRKSFYTLSGILCFIRALAQKNENLIELVYSELLLSVQQLF